MRRQARDGCQSAGRGLLADTRGGTIETIIIIGCFVFAIVAGVRFLGGSANTTLACHGGTVLAYGTNGTPVCRAQNPAGSPTAPSTVAMENLPPRQVGPARNGPPRPVCDGITCSCFVAGTPVLTKEGPRPIEEIRPGDLVWARDELGPDQGWKPVVQTFVKPTDEVLALEVATAEGLPTLIEVTANHPVFVIGRGWTLVGELVPGRDRLTDDRGFPVAVLAVTARAGSQLVYNFEVADHHTYYAGTARIWAHNMCGDEDLVFPDGDGASVYGTPVGSISNVSSGPPSLPDINTTNGGGAGPSSFGAGPSSGGGGGGPPSNGGIASGNQAPPPPLPAPQIPADLGGGFLLQPGQYTFAGNFPGQERLHHNNGEGGTFLNDQGNVNIVNRTTTETPLYVSPNALIAIEVRNQPYRESKLFFADAAQVNVWNDELRARRSRFELVVQNADNPQVLTFTHPTSGTQHQLVPIEARITGRPETQGCNNLTMPGDCANSANQVLGLGAYPTPRFRDNHLPRIPAGDQPIIVRNDFMNYQVLGDILGIWRKVNLDRLNDRQNHREALRFRDKYVRAVQSWRPGNLFDGGLRKYGINQYAEARVGDVFATFRIGPDLTGYEDRIPAQHWAGVVAIDGTTTITLEN
jgi:hypothetical protein